VVDLEGLLSENTPALLLNFVSEALDKDSSGTLVEKSVEEYIPLPLLPT
jgi:hypothetical protein